MKSFHEEKPIGVYTMQDIQKGKQCPRLVYTTIRKDEYNENTDHAWFENCIGEHCMLFVEVGKLFRNQEAPIAVYSCGLMQNRF